MSQELPTINGELLRLRRETRGWALSDLATRACMSVKQIRQLEEGGASAFYSETVKWTSAKKVGTLLGMQPEEVFVQVVAEPEVQPETVAEPAAVQAPVTARAEPPAMHASGGDDAADVNTTLSTPPAAGTPEKSKTSVFALTALFAAALAVAAWMRPEPEVVTEPVPPLQNITAEATDAKPASEAAVDAAVVETQAPKPASASSAAASPASLPAAAVPASSPASLSAVMAKPANAVQAPASAASAASKPL